MNSFNNILKSLGTKLSTLLRPDTSTVLRRAPSPLVSSAQSQFHFQVRSYYGHGHSSEQKEEDRLFPIYIQPVSKVALQHLQDSRAGWLSEQGLDRGLQIKPNGTFLLKFPSRKGSDAGKIWTSYDSSTKKHWLSVYRQKFNAKYLLTESHREELGKSRVPEDTHKTMSLEAKMAKLQIQSTVDEMVRLVPPPHCSAGSSNSQKYYG